MRQVLLVCAEQALESVLERCLVEAGYLVRATPCLNDACGKLYALPEVVLLDLELAVRQETAFAKFLSDCQLADIPCLGYSSNGMNGVRMAELLPPGAGLIHQPTNPQEVLGQLSQQFEIRRLVDVQRLLEGRLHEKQRELEAGLKSAAAIQQSLLPTFLPCTDRFRFAWRFIPCEQVGGDLLNLLQLSENQLMAYLLDVSGHGVSSAMVTVSVYQSLSLQTGRIVKRPLEVPPYYEVPGPADVLAALEAEYPFERFEKFFTISYLLFDSQSGRLRYSNGGHPPPVLVHCDGMVDRLDQGGSLIGMGGLVPFGEGEVILKEGDRVYLYSDGITEHPSQTGELYGEERLLNLLTVTRSLDLDEVCDQVVTSVQGFGGSEALRDDVSLLAVEYLGAGPGA